jgi:hypothetical protein
LRISANNEERSLHGSIAFVVSKHHIILIQDTYDHPAISFKVNMEIKNVIEVLEELINQSETLGI